MNKITTKINEYNGWVSGVVFKNSPKLKLSKSVFEANIKGAVNYGANACAELILNEYMKGNYDSFEEIIGDLQQILVNTFNSNRNILKLRSNSIDLGNIAFETETKRANNKEKSEEYIKVLEDLLIRSSVLINDTIGDKEEAKILNKKIDEVIDGN
ncbi:MAG: hypothetical protein ACTSU6_04770 [Candidatus Njordarchaeales archaeon]